MLHNCHASLRRLDDLIKEVGPVIRQWSLGSAIMRLRSLVSTAVLPLTRTSSVDHSGEWEERGKRVVVEGFDIKITLKDLLRLEKNGWLNDNLINFYLKVGRGCWVFKCKVSFVYR